MKVTAAFAALCFAALCVSPAHAEEIAVQGGSIDLQFTARTDARFQAMCDVWVQNAASAVITWFGQFPVRHVTLEVTPVAGRKVNDGMTFGWDGARITVSVGRDSTTATLADDWVLTHEMIHLGLPDLAERHHWLEEGLAVYIEPFSRVRAGLLTPERAWSDVVENFPQGEPEPGDRGLDHTPTWGRTYYGGALFCLRADVEIRKRTGNRHSLQDVSRAILAAGGTIEKSWPIERVLAVGDAATGTSVLRELYAETKAAPAPVDLPALWKQLGLSPTGRTVTFDDTAPLSALRRAITGIPETAR